MSRGLFDEYMHSKTWSLVELAPAELGDLYYPGANWSYASKSGRLADGARMFENEHDVAHPKYESDKERILRISNRYQRGDHLERPIAVQENARIILVEGCARTTAYIIASLPRPLSMFYGVSPSFG